jgi:CheY-like chemotaxis protein
VRTSTGGDPILAGIRILLADDARDNRKIVSWHLHRAGAVVDLAANGQIAVDMALAAWASGRGYAAVLMDMQMPELDGFAATRLLREKKFERPIIALTAHAMTGDREQCLAAGCDDYATKPIDPHDLVLTLARWVALRPPVDDIAAALPKKAEPAAPVDDSAAEARKGSGLEPG